LSYGPVSIRVSEDHLSSSKMGVEVGRFAFNSRSPETDYTKIKTGKTRRFVKPSTFQSRAIS